ncbi:MAG: methionyl-tRNA formyltransferase [Flavobacteriales bacterium]|nr:methionyl-tRNA formyltransferase [Flavobacteriales bacterium]
MNAKRILFMGTPDFAVGSLNALVEAGFDVAAVVTAPDKPAGRGRELRISAVKKRALELGLPVLQPVRLRDPAFLETLNSLHASLYVVVAFRMLPEVVWSKPPLGTINLHASLLPQYRGAAPINWAIINGETETGVTTFFIRHEIDTGDIIDQESVAIGPDDNVGKLHDRLMRTGAMLLTRTVASILNGTARRQEQFVRPSHGEPVLRHAPKLNQESCRIDWTRSAQRIHDHVRGLSPYPGAWTQLLSTARGTLNFKVNTTRPADGTSFGTPGSVRQQDDRLFVACGSGMIELLEVQPEGRRRMTASEFLHGATALGEFHLQ